MKRILWFSILITLMTCAQRAKAQPPPASIVINQSNVTGGTVNNCLYITTARKVGSIACSGGGGSGTVTSVGTGNGLTGGPITTTGTISGINAAADGSTKGVSAFTAADFNATTGLISLDYTNGQKASGAQPGFLSSADWTTFNNKGSGNGTVTSVGLAGTANQITVTGATPITGSGSWTLSIPTNPTLPGTTTGAFSGNLTGNVTGNASTATNIANNQGTTITVLHGNAAGSPAFGSIVAADITNATITGTQIASSVALAGSPTTTTQSALDSSTKIATTSYVDTAGKRARSLNFIFDGGGSAATTGNTVAQTIPFACTISAYNISADAGTATFKLWKIATGTAIPTVSNSINTSGIALATGTSIHSTTTSDFTTTAVAANDIVIGQLSAVATATWVSVGIQCDAN